MVCFVSKELRRSLLPVTSSFFPRSQNSSTTANTSMISPTKSGSSSDTLGQKSKMARTTEPASMFLQPRKTGQKEIGKRNYLRHWNIGPYLENDKA